MSASGAALLEVSGLEVSLGGRPVLTGVDLRVGPGELVGLLGPNGAGKTTLLRAVLGLVRRRGGEVLVGGRPVDGTVRRSIGYVPQRLDVAWDYPVTVSDMVLTGCWPRLGPWRRPSLADHRAVTAAMERVGMTALADRPLGELSGGQRQRVLVARALVDDPRLLLLDEPFTGLDMPSQEVLLGLFADLAAGGCAVVMSTHDLASAMATCSRLVLLRGSVRTDGTPEELRHPDPWTETFEVGSGSPLLAGVLGGVRC